MNDILVPSSFLPSFYIGSARTELEEMTLEEKKKGGYRSEKKVLPRSGLDLT